MSHRAVGGFELAPRPLVRDLACGLVLIGAPLTALTLYAGQALSGAALGILTVVLPLWAIWFQSGRRIVVDHRSVLVLRGPRVVREFCYADLTEVRPAYDGSSGAATPEPFNRSAVLLGTTTAGKRRGVKVTELTVEDIGPLLRALEPVVAERPELLHRPGYRAVFEELLRQR